MFSIRLMTVGFIICVLFSEHAQCAPPNVLLLMGDDHGWEETGYNGHPHVKTPVLDEMAATGLRLERFYAAHPNCSPTRGSFLTGRHLNRYGTFAPGWSIRPEEITIAHIMRDAGYRCGHFGKWHVGPVKKESPTSPGAMGFHEWLSHDNFFEMNPTLSRNGGPPRVIDGNLPKRDNPLYFWMFGVASGSKAPPQPWIAPELQQGTTPMVKLMGGKATRDFTNFHHPTVTEKDYRGPRTIIQDDFKLVIHDRGESDRRLELFNLADDPAEQINLAKQMPELVQTMGSALRQW
jgi:arylsulfatase A-like enzyme